MNIKENIMKVETTEPKMKRHSVRSSNGVLASSWKKSAGSAT